MSSQEWELRIDGLSFHAPTDEDWFDITVVPRFDPRSFPDRPGCVTMMEISYRSDEAYRGDSQSPSGGLVEWTRSPSVFDERLSAAHLGKEPLRFRLTPAAGARAAHYDLVLRFRALTAFGADLCAFPGP